MTYTEIIERSVFMAHKFMPDIAMDRFRGTAEAVFPSVVEELAQSVAANLDHPWRSVIQGVTAALSDGDLIPETDADGTPIIGEYGFVKDAGNGQMLTDMFTASEIRRLNENPGDWRKIEVYAFAILKPRIYHTRDSVTIDVCVLDEADITAAIAADEVPIFPDAAGAYVTALVSKLATGNVRFEADDLLALTVRTGTQ